MWATVKWCLQKLRFSACTNNLRKGWSVATGNKDIYFAMQKCVWSSL